MRKKFIFLFIFIFIFFIVCTSNVYAEENPIIEYETHIQNIGWQKSVQSGALSGTEGKSLRLEGTKIRILNLESISGEVEYSTHVQNIGWQPFVKNGEMAGTEGKSYRLEGIKIRLTGELAEKYDVYYQTHIQNIGWQKWVKNGEMAGTEGKSLRLEAIKIRLISKENKIDLTYKSYVSGSWQNYVTSGQITGTTGESKKIEAINLNLINNSGLSGDILYETYINPNGWQGYKNNNIQSGEIGKSIEALRIKLTDEIANEYDIYYRTHVSGIGWLDWAKNGEISGTIGYFKNIEAVEIQLKNKVDTSINVGNNAFMESVNSITYSSHVQNIGWQNFVKDGSTAGTEGKSLRLEAYKIKLSTKLSGSVSYQTYVEKKGWQNYLKDGAISGTIGESKKIEAISIKLEGTISNYYDIYYRVHASGKGWLAWAKNGEKAGSVNNRAQLESFEVKIVKKGLTGPSTSGEKYITGHWNASKTQYYNYNNKLVTGFYFIDGQKYYFNKNGKLIGSNVDQVIDVSSYQQNIDWDTIKRDGDIDFAIIRVGWGVSYMSNNNPCGLDSQFEYNISNLKRLGIPYALYIYGYAKDAATGEKEAKFVISQMEKWGISKNTYVWYDAEEDPNKGYNINTYKAAIPAFANYMKSKGYNNVGVYGSLIRFTNSPANGGYLNDDSIKQYPLWVAQYYTEIQYPTYKGWQMSSDGEVNGISGRVDMNMFKK